MVYTIFVQQSNRKFVIGVSVHRGKGNLGVGLSGNLSSGTWPIGDNNNANFYFPIHNNNLKHNATESSYGQPTLFIVPSAEQGSSSTVQSFFRNITHMIQIWQFYSFRIVFDH